MLHTFWGRIWTSHGAPPSSIRKNLKVTEKQIEIAASGMKCCQRDLEFIA